MASNASRRMWKQSYLHLSANAADHIFTTTAGNSCIAMSIHSFTRLFVYLLACLLVQPTSFHACCPWNLSVGCLDLATSAYTVMCAVRNWPPFCNPAAAACHSRCMTLLRHALTQQQELHQPTDKRALQEEHHNLDTLLAQQAMPITSLIPSRQSLSHAT